MIERTRSPLLSAPNLVLAYSDLQAEAAAVREGRIHEIKSARILQPGPSLGEGLEEMAKIIKEWGMVRKGAHPFPPHLCSA